MINFAKNVKKYVPEVLFSVVKETLTEAELLQAYESGAKIPDALVPEALSGYGRILKSAATSEEAIANATFIEKTVDDDVYFAFEYPFMNDVMRIVKEEEPEILEQAYDMDCLMRLRIRRSMMPKLRARLEKVETLRFIEEEEEGEEE